MQDFRKILVGVDLSHGDRLADPELNPPTTEAVRRAIWLASHTGAQLTFLAAFDLLAHTEELVHEHQDIVTEDVKDVANRVLDGLVEQAQKEGVANADHRLLFGPPWKELLKAVVQDGYDLVVVGTHNRGPASRMIFGSTGLKLLRNCPCPVWVTKPDPDISDINMLVASDLSENSLDLLRVAIGKGQVSNAKIHVLHAVERPSAGWIFNRKTPEEIDAQMQARRDQADQKLKAQLSQTDWRTVSGGVKLHVVDGPAPEAILKAIEEHEIDLLVMGTAREAGLIGSLMGSTAEKLLAQVPCSVLVIKPRGFQSPVRFD